MTKTILITGSTAGIGLHTARKLIADGHRVLLHGRNAEKLASLEQELGDGAPQVSPSTYCADLSKLSDVAKLAEAVAADHPQLDVLINNAGVFGSPSVRAVDGVDIRFVVNTIAPYVLAHRLRGNLGPNGRIVNLSSAAQAPVDIRAFAEDLGLSDNAAYAQSKLALTMWTAGLAKRWGKDDPLVVSVNPGSLLATKMVKDAFGVAGNDINIGVDILCRAALSDEFAGASGKYFDNDARRFGPPHRDASNGERVAAVLVALDEALTNVVA